VQNIQEEMTGTKNNSWPAFQIDIHYGLRKRINICLEPERSVE